MNFVEGTINDTKYQLNLENNPIPSIEKLVGNFISNRMAHRVIQQKLRKTGFMAMTRHVLSDPSAFQLKQN